MKLGTKIVLGFIATSLIFVAVNAVIFISLQGVRNGAVALKDEIMPANDLVSTIQYEMAMGSLYVADFNYSGNPASWKRFNEEFNPRLTDELQKLAAAMSTGEAASDPHHGEATGNP